MMGKQAEHELPSDTKPVAYWREEGLLPNINKSIAEATRVAIVVIMQTGAQVTVGKVEYNVSTFPSSSILSLFNLDIPTV